MREFPNATARPWQRVGWPSCGLYGPGDIADAKRIATIDRRTECDDNAALIVHAVNTMEERERLLEEAAEVLRELADLMEDAREGGYKPDSFTCQPVRAFLAKLEARDD